MKAPASLQLRISLSVAAVILVAAIAAGFYVRLELLDGDATAALELEYVELLVLLAPFAIAAPLVAHAAARWSLRPLQRIEQDAEAVSPRNPEQRLSEDRAPLEARGLVRAVNRALDRMAAAYDHERQFTSNAAHALRTPLSVMSLRLQRAIDEGQLDPSVYTNDLQRLGRVVDQLLTLGRFDAVEPQLEKLQVDLSRMARGVAAELLPIAEAKGRTIELLADRSQLALAHEESVSLIIRNLVENALFHGNGTIRIATGSNDGSVWVSVEDDGSGPPPEIRVNTFNRFVRSSISRGSGLGLSIARDAAREAGGDIHWGEGSTICLTLMAPSCHS
ncbi:MAG TPA: HAMP domain-containing sensor histidine kinase [Bauldia sp.]|nr:HAMP domain-containing sensor histidine kinase [Bauldia sp.]